jgi:hypothetical protein
LQIKIKFIRILKRRSEFVKNFGIFFDTLN